MSQYSIIKLKRGISRAINNYTPLDGELVFAVDTKRIVIGDDNIKGGVNILQGNEDYLNTPKYYGSNNRSIRGFHDIPFNIVENNYILDIDGIGASFENYNNVDVIKLDNSNDGSADITFTYPEWFDRYKNINFKIVYAGDASASGNLALNISVWSIPNKGTISAYTTADTSSTYTIALTSSDEDVVKILNPINVYSSADRSYSLVGGSYVESRSNNLLVTIKIERDVSEDTYTGNLYILGVYAYQVTNGTAYGYYCGGQDSLTNYTDVDRIMFPFDNITATASGDLKTATYLASGFNSRTRGIITGGYDNSDTQCKTIQAFTFPFNDNISVDIGDLSEIKSHTCGFNSSTYGYIIGGKDSSLDALNIIEKFNLSFDEGNSETAGYIIEDETFSSGCNSSNYGFVMGGTESKSIERIDFALDDSISEGRGSLSVVKYEGASFNSSTHGYFCGGNDDTSYVDDIERITFDFDSGDATIVGTINDNRSGSGCNSTEKGFVIGGSNSGGNISTIEELDFSTDTSTTNMGNITSAREYGVAIDGIDFSVMFV